MEPANFYFEEKWQKYFEIIMFLIVAEAQCVKLGNLNSTFLYEEPRQDENKKPNGQLEISS